MSEPAGKMTIWNNAIVVLALMFTIPAALVVGAFFVTAQYGRIPGGTTTTCERSINGVNFRIEQYRYQAGLTAYELQTFSVSSDGETWREIIKVDIQAPRGVTCEANIQQLAPDTVLLTTQKALTISHDSGESWYTHVVCDDPRPAGGRCDTDPLNYVSVTFDNPRHGRVLVQESVTDEYGVPLYNAAGQPRITNEYLLVTDNGGVTWTLAND